MKKILIPTIVTICGVAHSICFASNLDAEVPLAVATWVEKDGNDYLINASSLHTNKSDEEPPVWSEIITVHRSEHPLTSTNLITLADQTELLFWAEIDKEKASIRYKSKATKAQNWGLASDLYDKGSENIGISLLRRQDQLWAFWASNDAELPEIRYSVLGNNGWSPSKLAHPRNNAPDLGPVAHLNSEGEVILNWLTYSFLQSSYVTAEKVLTDPLDTPELIDIIDVDDFESPDFLPTGQAVTIRFPRNQLRQSINAANTNSPSLE